MADNTVLSTGSGGDTIATDDIAGIKYQRVKLVEGADGVNDGDISASNPLPVTDAAVLVDDAAFTPATSSVLPVGFEFDDTLPDSVNEGDIGAARMSANRNIYTTLRDAAGNERGANVNASNQLSVSVDNTPTVTVGTFPDNEPFNLAQAAGTTLLVGNGVTGAGSPRVTIASDNTAFSVNIGTFPDNEPFNVAQWGGTAVVNGGTAGTVGVAGIQAHDAALSGNNPVLLGASMETPADSAPSTRSGTDADLTRLATIDGALFVIPGGPQQWKARLTGLISADTTVKAAPGAGLSLYVTTVVFSIGAATASSILLEESTTTAVFGPHYLEAVSGRGVAVNFSPPIKIAANTLLSATGSGATTATLDVYGFTAPG